MNENTSLEFSISIQLAVKIAHVVKLLLTRINKAVYRENGNLEIIGISKQARINKNPFYTAEGELFVFFLG